MIVVKLIGGLGNQLFQYAFGRYLAHVHDVPLKLDVGAFDHYRLHRYSLCHFNIVEQFASPADIKELVSLYRDDVPYFERSILSEWAMNPDFDPRLLDLDILKAGPNVFLDGYWSSEVYFKPIEHILRHEFRVKHPLERKNKEIARLLESCNSVSLHIRRGDYVTNPDCIVCTDDYYKQAVQLVAARVRDPHFFIFSDDPAWARENFRSEYPFTLVDHNDADTNYEDIRLMSLCKHNIIANSTFSWWGAWLNDNPEKIVVAPHRWFKRRDLDAANMIPAGWIRLKTDTGRYQSGKPARTYTIGVWNYYEELNLNNRMFKVSDVGIGDDLLKPWNDLHRTGRENGIEFVSLDRVDSMGAVDAFLFVDLPDRRHPLVQQALATAAPKYLLTYETEVVKPENWDVQNHEPFRKVFTWNDAWVDNDKYLKINFAQDIPEKIEKNLARKKKLCALIASNKHSSHPNELYSARRQAIEWFASNHPDDLDLYGVGWSPEEFGVYRGRVKSKHETLKGYRFSICYENAAGYPGYITEKIFDCFKAGCVPIYLGAPNIADYVPADCFVDRRQFSSDADLHRFISTINEDAYLAYLDRIETFLAGTVPYQNGRYQYSYPFSTDCFVWSLIGELSKDVADAKGDAPLVSVAIPAYNYGAFLGQAVESVLQQDVDNLEVIVLDNASTDCTPEVMAAYLSDQRVRYVRHARNIGGYNNWNRCLQLASGKYLVILGADDYLCGGHLGKLVNALEAHPQCSLAYTPCTWVDENGATLRILDHPGHRPESYIGGRTELADLLAYDSYITPSAAVIRRESLRGIGGFDARIRGAIDWDLWVRIAARNPNFIFFKHPTACYRVHGKQDSNDFYASVFPLLDHMRILEKLIGSADVSFLRPFSGAILDHLRRRFSAYSPEMTGQYVDRLTTIEEGLVGTGLNQKNAGSESLLVSVVIPTRDRPDLLIRAVRSVKAQTYPYIEILVVNDAGVDVGPVMAWLGDVREITYIRLSAHKGVSAARNAALRAAKGQIIAYLDDDDVFLPEHVATLVRGLRDKGAQFVFTQTEHVVEELENGIYKEIGRDRPYRNISYSKERLRISNFIPIDAWGHWKSCLDQVGYFDEGLDNHEDWDFLLRCIQKFELAPLDALTAQVHVRRRSDNAMRRLRSKFYATFNLLYERYGDLGNQSVAEGRRKMLDQILQQGEPPALAVAGKVEQTDEAGREHHEYRAWRSKRTLQEIDAQIFGERMTLKWRERPLFNLVVTLGQGQEALLADTLDSIAAQFYPDWRLTVVAPFQAPDAAFHEVPNLQWLEAPAGGGVVEVLNAVAASLGRGWIAFLPAGARVEAHTLLRLGDYIDLHPEWRLIYADDDQADAAGEFVNPRFKPDFNLDLLRSTDYIGPCMLRADALVEAGGYSGLDGAEGYDMSLRVLDQHGEQAIGHVADVLIHLPVGWDSVGDEGNRRYAVAGHLARRNIAATVAEGYVPGTHRVIYARPDDPLVSIVIPNRDKLEFLQPCIESLLEKTGYRHYEVLIIDNQSADPDVLDYYQDLRVRYPERVRILPYDAPFNFSAMNNLAAREARGDYLLLLNNDTQIVQGDWLERMLSYGQRAEVGAVGARLVYPETGKLQHAGVVLGIGNIADHPFNGVLSITEPGYMNRAQVDQNYSAVTAACLLMRKSVYLQVGGMDEERLKVLYNDVDLCLKVGQAGYKIVWTPYATVVHHGSTSLKGEAVDLMKLALGNERAKQERGTMLERWLPVLANDPAYNRHLSFQQPGYQVEGTVVIDWDTNFHDRPRLLASPLSGGSGEYRVIGPFRALSRAGLAQCDVIQMGQMFKTRVLMPVEVERAKPDTLVLQAAIDNTQMEALELYKQFNSDVLRVFTLDDLLTQVPKQNTFYRYSYKDAKPRLRKALALCDRAIVTTEPLAELCRAMIGDVRVIPNRLERALWGDVQSLRRHGAKPRVGWAGAQQHAGDLALIADVVRATAQEVDWVFFGMCPEELRPYVREFHDFVLSFYAYPAKLASLNLDLAVAPLEINPFNEAKSNLRLLEYGMMGWPVVCSDIYPYQDAPVKRVANEPQAWIEAIRERVHGPDAAEREGDQLKEWVNRHFILEDHLDVWLRALVR